MHTQSQPKADKQMHRRKLFLARHSGKFFGLFLILLLVSICVFAYTAGLLQIRPTELILAPKGCMLVQRYEIHTVTLDSSGACKANVMFRSSILKDTLYIDDEPVYLSQSEVIAIVPGTGDIPWTGKQKRWVATCLALLVLTISMAVLNEIGSEKRK